MWSSKKKNRIALFVDGHLGYLVNLVPVDEAGTPEVIYSIVELCSALQYINALYETKN